MVSYNYEDFIVSGIAFERPCITLVDPVSTRPHFCVKPGIRCIVVCYAKCDEFGIEEIRTPLLKTVGTRPTGSTFLTSARCMARCDILHSTFRLSCSGCCWQLAEYRTLLTSCTNIACLADFLTLCNLKRASSTLNTCICQAKKLSKSNTICSSYCKNRK